MRGNYAGKSRRIARRKQSSGKQVTNVFLIVVACLLLLWTLAGPFGLWKLYKMKQYRRTLYAKVIDASKENTMLKQQIQAFKSDKKFQEEMVRKKLGWVRRDEIVYKFIGRGSSSR